jgi:ribosomal protein L16 Arg81 hydroxylase
MTISKWFLGLIAKVRGTKNSDVLESQEKVQEIGDLIPMLEENEVVVKLNNQTNQLDVFCRSQLTEQQLADIQRGVSPEGLDVYHL